MLAPPMRSDPDGTNREPLLVLENPIAGNGRGARAAAALRAALAAHAVPFASCTTTHRGHARALAAAATPGRTIVVVGGDGSVHEVLNGLPVHAGAIGPLAVLPCGSGDDLASSLRLSRDPRQLAAALAHDAPRALDVAVASYAGPDGLVHERFANSAAFGLDAEVAIEACKPHRLRGRLLYAAATLAVLRRNPRFQATITAGGAGRTPTTIHGEWSFLATCNGQFIGGGMRLVPDGRCDDGQLDAVAVAACPRRTILWLFAKLLTGRHRGDPRLHTLRSARIDVTTDRPVHGALDGEPLPAPVTAITYTIAPERLWFLGARC